MPNKQELLRELIQLANKAHQTHDTKAIAAILYTLCSAIVANQDRSLMQHVTDFSEHVIHDLQSGNN